MLKDTHSHVLTIPGTSFRAFVSSEDRGLKLLSQLEKTARVKRRKVQPVMVTADQWKVENDGR